MKDEEIIAQTFQNLFPILHCEGKWEPHAKKELDAYITLKFPDGDIRFDAEVKQEVLLPGKKLLTSSGSGPSGPVVRCSDCSRIMKLGCCREHNFDTKSTQFSESQKEKWKKLG